MGTTKRCTNQSFIFQNNAFDWMRIYSAVIIIIGHCIVYMNITLPSILGVFLNQWRGMICLFTITGFLVPASLERSRNNRQFLMKRFARIYPGLWGALVVSCIAVLVIGFWQGIHYKLVDFIKWIPAQMSFFQFYTPGSIAQYGVGNPNGALWSISIEIQVYIVMMVSWKRLSMLKKSQWFVLIVISVAINVIFGLINGYLPVLVGKLINVTFVPYAYVFLLGMFFYRYRDEVIPKLSSKFWYLLLGYLAWFIFNREVLHIHIGHYADLDVALMVSIITISGGYYFGRHRIKHEISFGLYIYHMIIVNVFVMLGGEGSAIYIPIIIGIATVFAMFSRKYIELPMMKVLKRRWDE